YNWAETRPDSPGRDSPPTTAHGRSRRRAPSRRSVAIGLDKIPPIHNRLHAPGVQTMCGIVGYVGFRDAIPFLVEGLRRLEYRGYDSAGIASLVDGRFSIAKTAGRIERLVEKLDQSPFQGTIGIGHTRWATHGPATEVNAHPHVGGNDLVAVVHNGVIENFQSLKDELLER